MSDGQQGPEENTVDVRRGLRLPAALGLLLVLAGCGGPTAGRGARTGSPAASAAAVPAAEPPAAAPPPGPAAPAPAVPALAAPAPAPAPAPAAPAPAPAAPVRTAPTAPSGASRPLAGRTVVLDAGHNGGNAAQPARANALVPAGGFTKPCNTTGTSTDAGYAEHAFTYDVVRRTAELLRAQGAAVVLTRTTDTGFGPCVNERAAVGNAASADAVIAVHADGGPPEGYGFHVIAPALAPDRGNAAILDRSYRLALAVRSAFSAGTGEPYATYTASQGLVRRTDLAGLNLSRVPAVFIECGNMRSAADEARLTDPAWRQRAAGGLDAALVDFLQR